MTRCAQNLLQLIHLSRLAMMFAAVSNLWLMIFLARELENVEHRTPVLTEGPLFILLSVGAVLAAGLHLHGAALNDVLHARHDRLFRPDRPIAAGRIGATTAVTVAVLSLLSAIGAGLFFGTTSVIICLAITAGILFYNVSGRFLPAAGIVTLGLVRAMYMFTVNPPLSFAWPIWLALTHVTATAAIAHRLEGRRPRLQGTELWALFAGWAFWSLALMFWITWVRTKTTWVQPGIWIQPIIMAVVFAAITWWVVAARGRTLRGARAAGAWYAPFALSWLILYDAGWLAGAGHYGLSLVHVSLFGAACASLGLDQLRLENRSSRTGKASYGATERVRS